MAPCGLSLVLTANVRLTFRKSLTTELLRDWMTPLSWKGTEREGERWSEERDRNGGRGRQREETEKRREEKKRERKREREEGEEKRERKFVHTRSRSSQLTPGRIKKKIEWQIKV